jgi:TatD DNase family protein
LKLGWDISISGVCTFKNSGELRETIKSLPVDRIHIETDAPFMTPVPHRGKENEPALLVHTAKFVAELLGVSEDKLAQQLKINAKKLFPKLQW